MRHAAILGSLFVLVVVSSAMADTIVLKNGHRIVASHVTEDGEHVSYDTPAGQMSIPKSIVARIERDDFTYSSAARAAALPDMSAPPVDTIRGYDDVVRLTIHDNSINFAYIAQLETEARSGRGATAVEKVTAAHYVAAQFLVGKGEISICNTTITAKPCPLHRTTSDCC